MLFNFPTSWYFQFSPFTQEMEIHSAMELFVNLSMVAATGCCDLAVNGAKMDYQINMRFPCTQSASFLLEVNLPQQGHFSLTHWDRLP